MDFGAVVCKPVPICIQCPFNKYCRAFKNDQVFSLPVKDKRLKIGKRWFNYIQFEYRGQIALRQRTGKDIWQNLFEFILIESSSILDEKELVEELSNQKWLERNDFEIVYVSPVFKQQLSHQLIEGRVIKIKLPKKTKREDVVWVRKSDVNNYPFPKFINYYLSSGIGTG
jgi:A/G-specific adenine glycosylase